MQSIKSEQNKWYNRPTKQFDHKPCWSHWVKPSVEESQGSVFLDSAFLERQDKWYNRPTKQFDHKPCWSDWVKPSEEESQGSVFLDSAFLEHIESD